VREILMLIDSTVRSKPDFRPESSQRHFRIACSDFVAEAVLTEVIVGMSRSAPGMRVDLLPLASDEVNLQLQRGELDLIIAPDYYCRADHLQAPIFSEPWTCVAWARNGAVGDTISLAQYTASEHVVLQPIGQVALDQHFLEQSRIERRVRVSVPVFTWMPQLLIGTERIATMPQRFAARYARTLPLKTVRPLFDIPPLNESMQWHPSRDRDQALAWLRQSILGVAGSAAGHAGRERS
jgi:DNA-binding transcriptional LysR family regulator